MEEQQQNLKREIASKSKLLKEREEEIALLTENETQMEREMKRLRTERKREAVSYTHLTLPTILRV